MNMWIKKEERKTFWMQVGAWAAMFVLPTFTSWLVTHSSDMAWLVARDALPVTLCFALIFFLNVYWLTPEYLFKEKRKRFNIYNNVLTLAVTAILLGVSYLVSDNHQPFQWGPFLINVLSKWGFCWVMVLFGQLTRTSMHQKTMTEQLKEEKQKRVEAELSMLKSQLNPHFLFNTLNNISSLVQIDADAAQESIGQLSDLLRYSLYDSNEKVMPIEREIEFMNNYIDLMRLRCNELAEIKVDMAQPENNIAIAPMLFISLIENAFKHGVNSRKPSFVHFSLHLDGDVLTFTSENSFFPKPDTDRIGSGVGIMNTQRRLNLIYPDAYEYKHEQRGNTYFSQIIIRHCV